MTLSSRSTSSLAASHSCRPGREFRALPRRCHPRALIILPSRQMTVASGRLACRAFASSQESTIQMPARRRFSRACHSGAPSTKFHAPSVQSLFPKGETSFERRMPDATPSPSSSNRAIDSMSLTNTPSKTGPRASEIATSYPGRTRRAGHNASAPTSPFSSPTFKQSSASPVDRSRIASSRDRANVLSDSDSDSFFSASTRSDSARRNSSSAFFNLSLASGNNASASPNLRKSSSNPFPSLCSSMSLVEISRRIFSSVSLR